MSYFECPPSGSEPDQNGNGVVDGKPLPLLSSHNNELETETGHYLIGQKLSQMSLTRMANCDQNGNPSYLPERPIQRPLPMANWSTGAVKHNLRAKLNRIKQIQNESQNHFRDALTNYRSFATCCRNQLDMLLQELNLELEQTFKTKIMELNHQRDQVEEILAKVDQEPGNWPNGKPEPNGGGDLGSQDTDEENFLATFDQDSVNMVKNVLGGQMPSLIDVRVPNVDPATMERMLRSLLIPLIKQQQQQFYPEIMPLPPAHPHQHHASPTFNHHHQHDSDNNSDSFNNQYHHHGQHHHHPFPPGVWHQTKHHQHHLNDFYHHQHQPPELILLNQKQALTKSLQPKIRRERISYYLKFGEQGAQEGQFAEPSGVAVNPVTDEIYIADANNHRIQVFDRWGKFRLHFGDGKLKFPNRVALSHQTGDVVVSERPPVHQIQVFNKNGTFLCKFGAKHLRHPRGLAVDHRNRVVVVECKVMRVFIFSLQGILQHSFDCSDQIQFPNAVAVSKQEEIYISDNRNHCVKVFNFNGEFLRQIGGQGITNYPIGVCLNEAAGQLLVIDNYNNLNVTVFRLDGQLMAAYESSAKHQQCLDVALFGDHSLVVTSKDLQVYLYRLHQYQQQNVNGPHQQSSASTTQYPPQKPTRNSNNNNKNGNANTTPTRHPAITPTSGQLNLG